MSQQATGMQSGMVVHPPEGIPYEVVLAYLDGCRKALPTLKVAMERSDFDFVTVYAHRMKGSGGAYGFPELTSIGASMEAAALARHGAELRDCAAALETHLQSVSVADT